MMSQLRFLLLSVSVFAIAFTGMTYASRGRVAFLPSTEQPVPAPAASPPDEMAQMPDLPAPPAIAATDAPATLAAHRPETAEEPPVLATSPSPGDADPRWMRRIDPPASTPAGLPPAAPPLHQAPLPLPRPAAKPAERDAGSPMRRSALQAARAYAQTPCDPAARAAFIVAVSTYMRTHETRDDGELRRAMQVAARVGGLAADHLPAELSGVLHASDASGRARSCEPGRRVAQR